MPEGIASHGVAAGPRSTGDSRLIELAQDPRLGGLRIGEGHHACASAKHGIVATSRVLRQSLACAGKGVSELVHGGCAGEAVRYRINPAGQTVDLTCGREFVVAVDADRRRPRKAQGLGLLMRLDSA